MKFCSECGTLIQGEECTKCKGLVRKATFSMGEEEVILRRDSGYKVDPEIINWDCKFCGGDKAECIGFQNRSADEGETYLITCLKCGKKVRRS